MKRVVILMIAIALAGSAACDRGNSVVPRNQNQDNVPVERSWTLKDLNGNAVSFADYKGKRGVFLIFFTTWCQGCMQEVPRLIEFQKMLEEKNIPVELIGVDVKQPARVVKRFADSFGINYTVVLDEEGAVADLYGVQGYPTNIGINAAGEIIFNNYELPEDLTEFANQLSEGAPKESEAPATE